MTTKAEPTSTRVIQDLPAGRSRALDAETLAASAKASGVSNASGSGSMSTIHARNSREVFERIATYAIMAQERLPHEASFRLIAGGLDYVVFISRHPKTGERRLESILEVNGYDDSVLASEIFAAGPYGSATWTGTMASRLD